jgi:(1->4)-alpha-D-glucan 1-alpha-D-glucosylmutase
LEFQTPISELGKLVSLSELVLKITCPGVPDIYQGNELWDLRSLSFPPSHSIPLISVFLSVCVCVILYSLVDPDNRRPVDFALRKRHLSELLSVAPENFARTLAELARNSDDGRIKLWVTMRGLRFHREK